MTTGWIAFFFLEDHVPAMWEMWGFVFFLLGSQLNALSQALTKILL